MQEPPAEALLQQQQHRQQHRQQHQQEAAIAHARELIQGNQSVGRSGGLSHPLYVPLYDDTALEKVLQQQQIASGGRYSSWSTIDQTADARVLEDILGVCPLLTPAATLVEKLSSRALHLDALKPQHSAREGAGAVAVPVPASASGGSCAESARGRERRGPLKLTRTQAKRLGLFDVRSEFEDPVRVRTDCYRSAIATGAPATVATSVPDVGCHAAAPVLNRRQVFSGPPTVGLRPSTTRVQAPAAATGKEASSSRLHRSKGADSYPANVGRKICYEDMKQLYDMWLQYARGVCGAREANASVLDSTEKSTWSGTGAPQPPHQQQHHQLHPGREWKQQSSLEGLRKQHDEPEEHGRKAGDRCMVMSKAAWQGARVCVVRSTTPTVVGLEGIIVEETQHSLLLLSPDQRLRRLLKHCVTLKAQTVDGSNFYLHPQHLQQSSAARSKVKFKMKDSLLL